MESYDTLEKCLFELKYCKLPVVDKLRLEMYLIKVKLNLLDYHVTVKFTAARDSEIRELYDQISHICRHDGRAPGLPEVTARLKSLAEGGR